MVVAVAFGRFSSDVSRTRFYSFCSVSAQFRSLFFFLLPLLTDPANVAHYSGTTIDAQERYANGTKEIIANYLQGKPQNPANAIVENGEYASKAYGQRK